MMGSHNVLTIVHSILRAVPFYNTQGFVDYLTGPSLDAKILRDNFVFKVRECRQCRMPNADCRMPNIEN